MNCNQARERFDHYLDGELDQAQRSSFEEHLDSCPPCQKALAEEITLRELLRQLPVEPATADFASRALREAARRGAKPRGGHGFTAGFFSALAAALMVWLTVGQPPAPDSLPDITLALSESRTVRLVFNAPRDVPEAVLALELPENLALAGFGEQRELVWRTALREGPNSLTLPLEALGIGEGELVARVRLGASEKRFQIRVSVSGNPV